MFLARALCDRLGGSFELTSRPGEGTVVRGPFAAGTGSERGVGDFHARARPRRRPLILVVDDDERLRERLGRALETRG